MAYQKPDLGTFASDFAAKWISFKSESKMLTSDNVKDAIHELADYIEGLGINPAVSLVNGQTIDIADKTTRLIVTTLGETGTINLPKIPGNNMVIDIKTAVEPKNILIKPHNADITFLDGTTETSISLQGHYDLCLYWNGVKYVEVQ